MSAITFTVDFTGTPDADDILAARHIVRLENERRTALNTATTAENARRAAQTPPLEPLPLLPILPTATGAQLKASYLGILSSRNLTDAHLDYIRQAKSAAAVEAQLTDADKQALYGAIQTRLNAGTPLATILADIQS